MTDTGEGKGVRGPLSEVERMAYADMEARGHHSSSAIGTVFKLDDALRSAIRERDEAWAQVIRIADFSAQELVKLQVERDEARAERDALRKAKAENDERFQLEIGELRAKLEKAVRYLRQGKAQFAPHTTNSDVDVFLSQIDGGEGK